MALHVCATLNKVLLEGDPRLAETLWRSLTAIDYEHAEWLLYHHFNKELLNHWN